VQDGTAHMAGNMAATVGEDLASGAEHALGPLAMTLGAGAEVAQAASEINSGIPADVAILSGGLKFGFGLGGGYLGATGGAALGVLTGPGAPVAVPAFAVAGGFGGSTLGESFGGYLGGLYANMRGYGACHVS
jgi:hypothetical protein